MIATRRSKLGALVLYLRHFTSHRKESKVISVALQKMRLVLLSGDSNVAKITWHWMPHGTLQPPTASMWPKCGFLTNSHIPRVLCSHSCHWQTASTLVVCLSL